MTQLFSESRVVSRRVETLSGTNCVVSARTACIAYKLYIKGSLVRPIQKWVSDHRRVTVGGVHWGVCQRKKKRNHILLLDPHIALLNRLVCVKVNVDDVLVFWLAGGWRIQGQKRDISFTIQFHFARHSKRIHVQLKLRNISQNLETSGNELKTHVSSILATSFSIPTNNVGIEPKACACAHLHADTLT